ncbi:hypothetical protein ACFYON_28940 [Micromonospora sp. NPDC005686]|uniref:hypothetical protein n=1 Tax=Micromonospora TaxID=1873 RepID=UPI0033AA4D59
MRVGLRAGVAASLGAALTLTIAPTAGYANVPSGNSTQNVYTSHRQSQQYWSSSTKKMYVNAILSANLPSGYCLDSWFDWTTPEGSSHYDSRGARTCVSNYSMYGDVVTESNSVAGMQKAGGAYGPNNNTTSTSYLVNAAGSTISIASINVVMNQYNCSIRYWKRTSSGVEYWTGGPPTNPNC